MNIVVASLEENLRKIKLVAEPTVEGFTHDRANTGDARELTVQDFIASYLTGDFQIKKRSPINGQHGSSQNIDCVVLYPNHPRLITPVREVIIAEGVYAAIEVKPDIATLTAGSEFTRGIKQLQTVKQIKRTSDDINLHSLTGEPKRSAYFDTIPTVIFSFKSQELIKVINYIRTLIEGKTISPFELPDIIISIDKGILFYCPHIKETIFRPYLDHLCSSYPDQIIVEIPATGANQLTWFLRLFLSLPAPSLSVYGHILFDYLKPTDTDTPIKFHVLDATEKLIKK